MIDYSDGMFLKSWFSFFFNSVGPHLYCAELSSNTPRYWPWKLVTAMITLAVYWVYYANHSYKNWYNKWDKTDILCYVMDRCSWIFNHYCYSIPSRIKQLFEINCYASVREKICCVSIPVYLQFLAQTVCTLYLLTYYQMFFAVLMLKNAFKF